MSFPFVSFFFTQLEIATLFFRKVLFLPQFGASALNNGSRKLHFTCSEVRDAAQCFMHVCRLYERRGEKKKKKKKEK